MMVAVTFPRGPIIVSKTKVKWRHAKLKQRPLRTKSNSSRALPLERKDKQADINLNLPHLTSLPLPPSTSILLSSAQHKTPERITTDITTSIRSSLSNQLQQRQKLAGPRGNKTSAGNTVRKYNSTQWRVAHLSYRHCQPDQDSPELRELRPRRLQSHRLLTPQKPAIYNTMLITLPNNWVPLPLRSLFSFLLPLCLNAHLSYIT